MVIFSNKSYTFQAHVLAAMDLLWIQLSTWVSHFGLQITPRQASKDTEPIWIAFGDCIRLTRAINLTWDLELHIIVLSKISEFSDHFWINWSSEPRYFFDSDHNVQWSWRLHHVSFFFEKVVNWFRRTLLQNIRKYLQ